MLLELVDESQKYVLNRVRLKHLYIETTVLKDFAQNLIFWKINFKPKIPYLRNQQDFEKV